MNSHLLYFLRRVVAMLGKIVMTLLALSSAALAQQQQCQLECTRVTQSGEARVTKSCYALDLSNGQHRRASNRREVDTNRSMTARH